MNMIKTSDDFIQEKNDKRKSIKFMIQNKKIIKLIDIFNDDILKKDFKNFLFIEDSEYLFDLKLKFENLGIPSSFLT
jgi:hypothetical protein